jgi:hypothetical protein
MVIDDASSFYLAIKSNPLYTFEMGDEQIIETIEKISRETLAAADRDLRRGLSRDRYIYFQAMMDGMRLQHKMWLQHLRTMAHKQGVEIGNS